MRQDYFLQTDRLGFSHWKVEDIDLALELWGNPEVVHYVSAKGFFTDKEVQEKFNLELSNMLNYGIQYYPLFLLEEAAFVGCCGFKPIEGEDGLEFGFYFLPQYWKQGFAQEAGQAILKYAINSLKPRAIFAGHHPHNNSSRQALIKLGFEYIKDTFYAPTGLEHPYYRLTSK